MRDAQTCFYFCHFLPLWCSSAYRARGRLSETKRRDGLRYQNPASKAGAHLCESEMPAWNSPADLLWKVLKMWEKHLKRRCLADVSHNAFSFSDMASCLSPIHMLMLNQDRQSGSFSSHGFFFPQVFPSNQFTLERDKSLKSHIRGEGSKW